MLQQIKNLRTVIRHMSIRTKIVIATFSIPFCLMLILPFALEKDASQEASRVDEEALTEELQSFIHIRNMILDRYVEEVDTRELTFSAIRGMVDPLEHARFYVPEEEDRFKEETSGAYIGLGLQCEKKDSKLLVRNTLYGSPARRTLRIGDEILEVDGASTRGLTVPEVYDLLRGDGEPGSECILKIRRASDDAIETCGLTRDSVSRPSVSCGTIVDREAGIGYVAVNRFLKHTHREFGAAMDRLDDEKIRALILDLRCNTGGVLDAALAIANLFIPEGVLVSTRGRYPAAERVYTAQRAQFRYPELDLIVLVNHESASAAEVLAGALQDYKRAVLIGTPTFGKGVVQSAITMELLDRQVTLKIPVALYFLPSGRCIEKKLGVRRSGDGGLDPDIRVDVTDKQLKALKKRLREISLTFEPQINQSDSGEEDLSPDPQLDAAVRLLKGGKVFTPLPDSKGNE